MQSLGARKIALSRALAARTVASSASDATKAAVFPTALDSRQDNAEVVVEWGEVVSHLSYLPIGVIMKSSRMFSLALITLFAMSSAAFAKGPGGAQGAGGMQGGVSASGTQSRIHTPGTGLGGDVTPTQTRIHAPGTGLGTGTPGAGQAQGAGAGRGIHTPGTGLPAATGAAAPASN